MSLVPAHCTVVELHAAREGGRSHIILSFSKLAKFRCNIVQQHMHRMKINADVTIDERV